MWLMQDRLQEIKRGLTQCPQVGGTGLERKCSISTVPTAQIQKPCFPSTDIC